MRELRTHGSTGRGPETGSRQRPNGHEAGNGGNGQVSAYGVPRRSPTLPSGCSPACTAHSQQNGLAKATASERRLSASRPPRSLPSPVTRRMLSTREMSTRPLCLRARAPDTGASQTKPSGIPRKRSQATTKYTSPSSTPMRITNRRKASGVACWRRHIPMPHATHRCKTTKAHRETS